MAIKHLAQGQDFGPEHFSKDFGFHGSSEHAPGARHGGHHRGKKHMAEGGHHEAAPPFAADEDTHGPKHVPEPEEVGGGDYAHGGHIHPHGHHVTHMTPHPEGGHMLHHAHGGYTHMHHDGHMTHHDARGGACHMARGGHHPGEGTYVGGEHHMARGGHADEAQDRALFGKMMKQHDKAEGENHLARGGMPRLPRGMKPMAERHRSPIETPPRNPNTTTTPRNSMPGGAMGYGVQPSSEPPDAGSDQGIPQMAHGGHRRHHGG